MTDAGWQPAFRLHTNAAHFWHIKRASLAVGSQPTQAVLTHVAVTGCWPDLGLGAGLGAVWVTATLRAELRTAF